VPLAVKRSNNLARWEFDPKNPEPQVTQPLLKLKLAAAFYSGNYNCIQD
jgi:hypothetical protein